MEAAPDSDDESHEEEFTQRKRQSETYDLAAIEHTQCIGKGRNSAGEVCIYYIPKLAFDLLSNTKSEADILYEMSLLFLRVTSPVTAEPFHVIYGHSRYSIQQQIKVIYEFYYLLPKPYRKNLRNLYIIHATTDLRLFLSVSSYFFVRSFQAKVHYLSTILDLQRIISPLLLQLPYHYLYYEDTQYISYDIASMSMPLLTTLFDESLGLPVLLHRCMQFLRKHAMCHEGLFRRNGDQMLFLLAKTRIIGNWRCVYIRDKEDAANADSTDINNVSLDLDSDSAKQCGLVSYDLMLASRRGFSVLVIDDIDLVAQIFKSFLRELPVSVITFDAFSALVDIVKIDSGEDYLPAINAELNKMPPAHITTLNNILIFLVELAANSSVNKMTIDNIAVVFAPTLTKTVSSDPGTVLLEIKIAQVVVKRLLLEKMESHIASSMTNKMSLRLMRSGDK